MSYRSTTLLQTSRRLLACLEGRYAHKNPPQSGAVQDKSNREEASLPTFGKNTSAGYGGTERNVNESTKKQHKKQESEIAKDGMDSDTPRGLDHKTGNSEDDARKAMHQNVRKGPMKNDHQDKGADHISPNETK